MEFLSEFMVAAVVGICLCVGYILKNVIPADGVNRFIPLIVGLLGVFLNVWMNGWVINPDVLLGGLASGLASTGMYELFHQFINRG